MVIRKSHLEKELTEFANEIVSLCCNKGTKNVAEVVNDKIKSLLSTNSVMLNTSLKKGDKVIFGENMNATVIEEFENGLVKINLVEFGEIKVLKEGIKLSINST